MKLVSPFLVALLLQTNTTPMRPIELHTQSMVTDLHCDALYQMVTKNYLITEDKGPAGYTPQITVDTLTEGKVDVQTFAVWVPTNRISDADVFAKQALEKFRAITKKDSAIMQARSADEVYRAKEQGKIAALLSIEGSETIGEKAEDLRPWAEAGLVLLGLAWNRKNAFCDAAQAKEKPFGGLSKEGEALVDLAAELGVLIDISHSSDDTFWDVMRRTTRPVIASHSSSRAVFYHLRNVDDEQIRAIRATGGVVGVNFHAPFLSAKRPVTYEEVIEHILHIMRVGGAQVGALGADFDGDILSPRGLESAAKVPLITEQLSKKGVPEEDIELFLGRNFLRALAKAKSKQFEAGSIPIPMRGLTVSASSQQEQHPAKLVADFSGLTHWRPIASDKKPTITIESKKAPRSIALRGALSADTEASISFTCGGQTQTKRVVIPDDIDGVLLHWELPTQDSSCRVEIELTSSKEIGLAEVVLYE
jgi:membrane dipeptidase